MMTYMYLSLLESEQINTLYFHTGQMEYPSTVPSSIASTYTRCYKHTMDQRFQVPVPIPDVTSIPWTRGPKSQYPYQMLQAYNGQVPVPIPDVKSIRTMDQKFQVQEPIPDVTTSFCLCYLASPCTIIG